MAGACQVRLLRTQVTRIMAVDGIKLVEHAEETGDVRGILTMDDIQVQGRDGCSVQDARRHPHDDEHSTSCVARRRRISTYRALFIQLPDLLCRLDELL